MGLTDVHKYSQMGQTRGIGGKGPEGGDLSREGIGAGMMGGEAGDPKEGWDKSMAKEPWDKSNSGMKSEQREWRDGKQGFGAQLQAQSSSGFISRPRHQPGREHGVGARQKDRLQRILRRVS